MDHNQETSGFGTLNTHQVKIITVKSSCNFKLSPVSKEVGKERIVPLLYKRRKSRHQHRRGLSKFYLHQQILQRFRRSKRDFIEDILKFENRNAEVYKDSGKGIKPLSNVN